MELSYGLSLFPPIIFLMDYSASMTVEMLSALKASSSSPAWFSPLFSISVLPEPLGVDIEKGGSSSVPSLVQAVVKGVSVAAIVSKLSV